MEELIINAQDLPLGRLAAFVAKKALQGMKITVANCEKAIITGSKKDILQDYLHRRQRGTTEKGPFFSKVPEKIVARAVRGMLPYKRGKGREAFKRIKYIKGEVKGMQNLKIKKDYTNKYITIEKLSSLL
ncbi:50S ribosomal protein L13 [Candidatus Pacearchaeota archaeon ex4484_26]|nr:MAG: 50S ribosomal protein L13 [Candidatus Pacearchaeota archaeon ex4484_26]